MEKELEIINVEISIYSEKTGDFIGCGIEFDTETSIQEQINSRSREIEDTLVECFWELISEFECSLQGAYEKIYPNDEFDPERIDAFDVFGNFVLSIKADGVDVENATLPFDINDFVYGYISYCDPTL